MHCLSDHWDTWKYHHWSTQFLLYRCQTWEAAKVQSTTDFLISSADDDNTQWVKSLGGWSLIPSQFCQQNLYRQSPHTIMPKEWNGSVHLDVCCYSWVPRWHALWWLLRCVGRLVIWTIVLANGKLVTYHYDVPVLLSVHLFTPWVVMFSKLGAHSCSSWLSSAAETFEQ